MLQRSMRGELKRLLQPDSLIHHMRPQKQAAQVKLTPDTFLKTRCQIIFRLLIRELKRSDFFTFLISFMLVCSINPLSHVMTLMHKNTQKVAV